MSRRRCSRHVTQVTAIAVALLPRLVFGQAIPGVTIDSSQFIVWTTGPDGERTSRVTNRVPFDPWTCYGWRMHFSKNSVGELAVREEFELPAPGTWPFSDQYERRNGDRVAVTKSRERPADGWIRSNEWCVDRGDPTGKYVITVYVQNHLAKAFEFFVAPRTREEDSAIAVVLGQEIRISQRFEMSDIVLSALLDRFARQHGLAPTPAEVSAVQARSFADSDEAMHFVRSWKVNQALFRQYGGRVSAQSAGPEPIDAYRAFLRDQEQQGSFKILDERLRNAFWRDFSADTLRTLLSSDEATKFFDQPVWEQPPPTPQGDPLSKLSGDWGLTVFVMGAGQFTGPVCGKGNGPGGPPVTVAPPRDGAISLTTACNDGSTYSFRLRHDSTARTFALTVQSGPGISVRDFPVAYIEGQGWQGKRDTLTALVVPIEGRLWTGWMIAVLPTAGLGHEDDLKKPFFRADLTRRK